MLLMHITGHTPHLFSSDISSVKYLVVLKLKSMKCVNLILIFL